MDESWRCTMGSVLPRQRSSEQQHAGGGGHQSLAPDDFRDVYGGPPRTVLLRSFGGEAADYHSPTGHHQYMNYGGAEAFCRRPYADGRAAAVPTEQGFFDDIFGARRHTRSRSRSKSKSSSAVSSDEFPAGFCRPVATGSRADATFSSFTSRLRPVTIPSRRYDSSPPSSTSTIGEYQSSFTCSTAAYPAARYYYGDAKAAGRSSNHSRGGDGSAAAHRRRHQRGSSNFCCFTSNPETSSNAPSFRQTRGARSPAAETTITDYSGADYGYYYSPPSATSSSLFTNPLARTPRRLEEVVMEVRERAPLLMDDGDDIDSVGAAAVDEAIAWAKERFWSQAR
ncbi:hypothetical protein SEVIR_4G275000v4 [Setaria viridis]|uniref:Uncharacterized protein n=2 Tax=Setaria TaxID=4554 RepID=K3Y1T4_SETIT|nr:uncharacterized protein LOC101766093 [Setaria italica]XP_034591339.1 uncharacterized protein LOC117853082 [Setaria viridis]RCV22969.1 hypothetical protein SETIT_4G262200v2 [Setaria italica]TKW23154.1 hypothetical protein SEVIR_4G275000v2 [Setaria viridis]